MSTIHPLHTLRFHRVMALSRFISCVLVSMACVVTGCGRKSSTPPRAVRLQSVGPRLISNQTSQPLSVTAEGLTPGARLRIGGPWNLELPLAVIDERHGYVRLPVPAMPPEVPQQSVQVELWSDKGKSGGALSIAVVNDSGFPDPTALVALRAGRWAAISSTTDALFTLSSESREVRSFAVGDGPSALAAWTDESQIEWLVIAHSFVPELWLVRADAPEAPHRTLPAPAYATAISIDSSGVAYVAEHATDTVQAIELKTGKLLWRALVAPNPRSLAVLDGALAVGSAQAGVVEWLDLATGAKRGEATPDRNTSIVGGTTGPFARYVMGGKAPRAMVGSARLKTLFYASLGPNIGPNPERMEVSPNSGVAIVPSGGDRVIRHLGFGTGSTEALALDERAGRLYAADIGVGRVRVLDVRALMRSDGAASRALIGDVVIPKPDASPSFRPESDFGVNGRAGLELHSGPKALALSEDGRTLAVLNRFTGTVAFVDTRGSPEVVSQLPLTPMLAQRVRRMGQVLYYADLGKTGMSCDGCHLEGHTGGLFFEKTHPMRIYRSTTVRGAVETAPYFTPTSTRSMAETCKVVGGRNRFQNPALSSDEVEALAAFSSAISTLPNPFVGRDGAPLDRLILPDGSTGNPRKGLLLFEGKGRCSTCHPAPQFTLDQDPPTRGQLLDVGTPHALPLRVVQQDPLFKGVGTPSLVGAWDIFPMLTSGAAGFGVKEDAQLSVMSRFPLREVLERYSGPQHGNAQAMTPEERNSLLAYLLSL